MDCGWLSADGPKPEKRKIIKLRKKNGDDKTFLALWNGEDYYIFNIFICEWESFDDYFSSWLNRDGYEPIANFEFSYPEEDAYKHMPYYALAYAKRSTVNG